MSMPTKKMLSPEQAAAFSGTSRRTIMRAIKSLEIKAIRNNRNHWSIDYDSVVLWAEAVKAGNHAQQFAHQNAHSDELFALRKDNSELRRRAEAAERDRDEWRDQARRDQLALHEAVKRRRWWWL